MLHEHHQTQTERGACACRFPEFWIEENNVSVQLNAPFFPHAATSTAVEQAAT